MAPSVWLHRVIYHPLNNARVSIGDVITFPIIIFQTRIAPQELVSWPLSSYSSEISLELSWYMKIHETRARKNDPPAFMCQMRLFGVSIVNPATFSPLNRRYSTLTQQTFRRKIYEFCAHYGPRSTNWRNMGRFSRSDSLSCLLSHRTWFSSVCLFKADSSTFKPLS